MSFLNLFSWLSIKDPNKETPKDHVLCKGCGKEYKNDNKHVISNEYLQFPFCSMECLTTTINFIDFRGSVKFCVNPSTKLNS